MRASSVRAAQQTPKTKKTSLSLASVRPPRITTIHSPKFNLKQPSQDPRLARPTTATNSTYVGAFGSCTGYFVPGSVPDTLCRDPYWILVPGSVLDT